MVRQGRNEIGRTREKKMKGEEEEEVKLASERRRWLMRGERGR